MKHRQVYASLIAVTFFWGANFNLGKFLATTMHPLAAAAWRFAVASVLMLVYVLATEGIDWPGARKNILALSAMAAVGIFGFNVSFFYGLQTTSAVNGALIMTLNPTITVILAALVMREKITWQQSFGLALSMVGVVVVVTGGSWHALATLRFATGDALILLGNLCWAAYSVMGKRTVKGMAPLQITLATMVIGAVAIIALALLLDTAVWRLPPPPGLLALGVMTLFGTVLGYLWWNKGIRALGPAKTAVFFDLVPLFTMAIAVALGEKLLLAQCIGAMFVIAGVLFSSGLLPAMFKKSPAAAVSAR